MKSFGVILIIIGLFLAIVIGANIYHEMQPITDPMLKAIFGNVPTYTYTPPFSTHEIVNMGLVLLGVILFFSGLGMCNSSPKKES